MGSTEECINRSSIQIQGNGGVNNGDINNGVYGRSISG